jgi:hypothetical protein
MTNMVYFMYLYPHQIMETLPDIIGNEINELFHNLLVYH